MKDPPRGAGRINFAAIDGYLRSCFARESSPRVSELARYLGVSRGTLIHELKQLRGVTPMKYLRQQQLERAKEFLRGDWSIEYVARKAGYGTKRAFYRAFHAETGTTPGVYRIGQSVPRH